MKTILQILNAIFNLLENNRWFIFGAIYLAGVVVYKFACKAEWLQSAYYAATLFTLNVETNLPNAINGSTSLLYIIGLIAALYTIISLVSLLAKQFIDKTHVKTITKEPYILVCGLGKKASAYIDSELNVGNKNILVLEKDINNSNIEKYRSKDVPVLVGDAKSFTLLKDLNLTNVQHFMILSGHDIDNLEIALAVRDILKIEDVALKKLFMHIEDRGLDKLYKEGGLLDDSSKLQVKMFSMARNSAKSIFLENDIDGTDRTYIDSNKSFGLVVAGNSSLAIEVIGQICEIAHLPNENRVIIYCIDKDAEAFKQSVEYYYTQINKILNIEIKYIESDYKSNAFYELDVWQKDITNVVLCYSAAKSNLDIATELADRTYLTSIQEKSLRTKIHIAIYDNKLIARHIKNNEEYLKYFDVFAETSYMASRDVVINEGFEMIAKFIHSDYGQVYHPDTMFTDLEYIDSKWNNKAKLSDRDSSRAQAYHIPVKLKVLGLKINPKISTKGRAELLLGNREFVTKGKFSDELKQLGLDDKALQHTTEKYANWETFQKEFTYFPKDFELVVEKLIRSEKNRWNAHHYLKGWVFDEHKNKDIKRHDCLVPIDQMSDKTRFTVLYDIYSILYIPNLLASVGYEIIKDTK